MSQRTQFVLGALRVRRERVVAFAQSARDIGQMRLAFRRLVALGGGGLQLSVRVRERVERETRVFIAIGEGEGRRGRSCRYVGCE